MNFTNIATEFCFFGLRNGWLMSWKLKVIDIKWDFWHTFITMCWTVRRYNIFSLTRSILQWSAKDHFMHGWVCSILYIQLFFLSLKNDAFYCLNMPTVLDHPFESEIIKSWHKRPKFKIVRYLRNFQAKMDTWKFRLGTLKSLVVEHARLDFSEFFATLLAYFSTCLLDKSEKSFLHAHLLILA